MERMLMVSVDIHDYDDDTDLDTGDDDDDDDTDDDTNDDTDDDTDDGGRGNLYSAKVPGRCCEYFSRQQLKNHLRQPCTFRPAAAGRGRFFKSLSDITWPIYD